MIRITGGIFRGRFIQAPKGMKTRPSTEMVRKAFFDRTQTLIQDALFLDLFAGSGAFGIEALSRGAKKAAFVEQSPHAARCIKANLASLDLQDKSDIYVMDAIKWLKANDTRFDLAYIDPPYDQTKLYTEVLGLMDEKQTAGAIFVESDKQALPDLNLKHLQLKETRRYGNVFIYNFFPIL